MKSKYKVVKLSDFVNRDRDVEPIKPKAYSLGINLGKIPQFQEPGFLPEIRGKGSGIAD